MKNRINVNINLIKIIAAFLVIINHTCFHLLDDYHLNFFYKLEFIICRIAVPLFIMCTGFLVGKKDINFTYSLKKIIRVLIPLILITFIICFRTNRFSFNFFINFFKDPIIEPYWYLYMLIGLYLMLPFLNKLERNLTIKEIIVLIVIILIIPSILNTFKINISSYFYSTFFSYIIGYYFLGILMFRIKDKKMSTIYFLIIFLITFMIGLFYFDLNDLSLYYQNSLLIVIMSFSFMQLILKLKIKNMDIINLIAKTTFGIYLIHPLIQNKVYMTIYKLNINYNLKLFLYQSIVFIICIIGTYLLIVCKEFLIHLNIKKSEKLSQKKLCN